MDCDIYIYIYIYIYIIYVQYTIYIIHIYIYIYIYILDIWITIDSIKKQALNAGPETIHQINFFNDNLDRGRNTTIFFITEEAKETISDFSQETNEKV